MVLSHSGATLRKVGEGGFIPVPYSPQRAAVPSSSVAADLKLANGATTKCKCKGFKDTGCPSGINIRSGSPGETPTITIEHPIEGAGGCGSKCCTSVSSDPQIHTTISGSIQLLAVSAVTACCLWHFLHLDLGSYS
jgi:hypothetical protein